MFSNFRSGWRAQLPPVTKNLIIINVIVWLAEVLIPGYGDKIVNLLGLHFFEGSMFNPAQVVTYMFLHSQQSITHLLFNMFSLWMFGRLLEQVWGSRRFLIYYMVCGIGAALIQEIVWLLTWEHEYISGVASFKNMMMTVGASGAVFGLLLGFAFVFPNMPLYLFFIPVPVKAKYMVLGYAVLEFFFGITGTQSTVAHFAHLGGMIFGLAILLYWKRKGTLRGNLF